MRLVVTGRRSPPSHRPHPTYTPTARLQFPITALREMRLLSALSHENVVRLEEIVTCAEGEDGTSSRRSSGGEGGGGGVPSFIYMVFEFCDGDLNDVLKAVREGRLRLTQSHLRCFARQMLEGLHYIHENKVIHRDIKGECVGRAGRSIRCVAFRCLPRTQNT